MIVLIREVNPKGTETIICAPSKLALRGQSTAEGELLRISEETVDRQLRIGGHGMIRWLHSGNIFTLEAQASFVICWSDSGEAFRYVLRGTVSGENCLFSLYVRTQNSLVLKQYGHSDGQMNPRICPATDIEAHSFHSVRVVI